MVGKTFSLLSYLKSQRSTRLAPGPFTCVLPLMVKELRFPPNDHVMAFQNGIHPLAGQLA